MADTRDVGVDRKSIDDKQKIEGQAGPWRLELAYCTITDLHPDPANPRKHSKEQISAIAASIKAFRFNAPILVDEHKVIIAGHGRYKAAKMLGMSHVPVVPLLYLTPEQKKAYRLADNKLTDRSSWDDVKVAQHLKDLSELAIDFEIEATGFELPEIDLRIQSLEELDTADDADEFITIVGSPVSVPGDLWSLGPHRLCCGSALETRSYQTLLGAEKAAAVFTDPPYNVKIDGNVCGNGATKHREFAMASGEMNQGEFSRFLRQSFDPIATHAIRGAIVYACMDWRHIAEILAAGHDTGFDLLNLCVWVKTNGGMGSLYRSQHELICVFRNGTHPHRNNVQLGRFGRNRTNVWTYAGANSFARAGKENVLDWHPTVKPVALVSDAILDSTKRDEIVLDPYVGSGTTILAAERTHRRCYAIEIDPLYVDTAIVRWETLTGKQAYHSSGKSFSDIRAERGTNR